MKQMFKNITEKVVDRVLQLVFWVILGFIAITVGLPLIGDVIVMFYESIRAYVVEAPTAEKATLGFLGLF